MPALHEDDHTRMKERIQKVLASAGIASRRAVEEMVLHGRIAVNGRIIAELPVMIDPAKDRIDIDGERIKLSAKETEPRVYLLMNKPKGVHSTNVAQGEQVRAIDLLPPNFRFRVYPVGRLDADSKGLLLLTNDGELTNQLTHPRYGVAKTYRAIVDGRVLPETVERLQSGVWLADRGKGGWKTGRTRIHVTKRLREKSVLEITIREGRNRQVRRMLASAGHKVRELTRVKMGPLTLHNLPVGAVRMLTAREVKELKKVPEARAVDWSLKRPVRAKSQRPSR
ncbi:MAG: rRNA pseudouridine synthase [Phycisphaerae bacterium]|nr:rRNA pseudouridine synthase [Phycisphaerae bacterium]